MGIFGEELARNVLCLVSQCAAPLPVILSCESDTHVIY